MHIYIIYDPFINDGIWPWYGQKNKIDAEIIHTIKN